MNLANKRLWQHLLPIAIGISTGVFILAATSFSPQFAIILSLALVFSFAGMASGYGKKLLLLVILFEVPIQMDIYLRYRESASLVNALPGLNISVTTIVLFILYAVWLMELLIRHTDIPPLLLRLILPSVTYLALVSFSLITATDAELAVFEIVLLFQAILLFIYIVHAIRTREELTFLITVLLAALVAESLIMIGLYLIGESFQVGIVEARIDPSGRVSGTIGSPNTAASFLIMLLAPSLGLFLARVNNWQKMLGIVAFSLGSIALLVTFSRGGLFGFLFSMLVFTIFAWRRGLIRIKFPFLIAVIVFVSIFVLREQIFSRFTNDLDAAYSRIPLVNLALQMIQDNSILGVGANNFAVELPNYITPDFGFDWITTVHNKYLLVWSETGLIGLITFLWFLFSSLRRGYRLLLENDPLLSPLALGFTAATAGFMMHMLFDLFHSRPQTQILWIAAGILAAMNSIAEAGSVRSSYQVLNKTISASSVPSLFHRLR